MSNLPPKRLFMTPFQYAIWIVMLAAAAAGFLFVRHSRAGGLSWVDWIIVAVAMAAAIVGYNLLRLWGGRRLPRNEDT